MVCFVCRVLILLQTPSSTMGVALHFQNYELKPKDMKSCDQGWWKISEVMYVSIHPERFL